jgi:hypothetical protein
MVCFGLGISSRLNPLWFYMGTTSAYRNKVSTSCSYRDEKGRSLCHCYCEVVLRKARQAKGGEERRLRGASGPTWLAALVYQPFLTPIIQSCILLSYSYLKMYLRQSDFLQYDIGEMRKTIIRNADESSSSHAP